MKPVKEAATEFLSNRRIAATRVSRDPHSHGSNFVYKRLRDRGYDVFAVNPNADEVEGDACYQDLRSIPGGVDSVRGNEMPPVSEVRLASPVAGPFGPTDTTMPKKELVG